MPVLQSGSITPGHLTTWVADGVIGDGGSLASQEQVLGYLNCSFNDTNDQPIPIPKSFQVFCVTRVVITNASLSLTTAAGGFYSGASKTGTTIVAAGQGYTFPTDSNKLIGATITASGAGTRWSAANLSALDTDNWELFLSLTTGQGAAATADVYLIGPNLTV